MKSSFDTKLCFLIGFIALSACSNAASIADEPLQSGDQKSFKVSYETLKVIIPQAIKATDVRVTQQSETPEGIAFLLNQPPRAFSWGYVGRVYLEHDTGDENNVYVVFERRASGLSNYSYSGKLFKEISVELAKH